MIFFYLAIVWFQITLVVFARWPTGPPGAAGALAAAVTKAIYAKGRRPAAANTLLSEAACTKISIISFFSPHEVSWESCPG